MPRPSHYLYPYLNAAALSAAFALAGCNGGGSGPLKAPPAMDYEKIVAAFQTGTIALQVGDNNRALPSLKEATQLAPNEPASWGNLALLYLKNGDLPKAEEALKGAEKAGGKTAPFMLLSAIIDSKQGKSESAIEKLRATMQEDPRNARAAYLLVQELGKQPNGAGDAESLKTLEGLLQAYPEDLVTLVETGRLAAKLGNKERLSAVVTTLKDLSGKWPAEARSHFDTVAKAAVTSPASASTPLLILGNLLSQTDAYRASAALLGRGSAVPADAIEEFVRLPNPPASASPADTTLTFTPEAVGKSKAQWARALLLSPALPSDQAKEQKPDSAAVWVVGGGGKISVGSTSLSFPGTFIPQEGVAVCDWNSDYLPDLALAGDKGVKLYQQSAAGGWTDVTASVKPAPAIMRGSASGIWAVDYELDGDIDLLVGSTSGAPIVLQNNADGTWSVKSGPKSMSPASLRWGDIDSDGAPDIVALRQNGDLQIWRNDRGGHYSPLKAQGVSFGKAQALTLAPRRGMGAVLAPICVAGSLIQVDPLGTGSGWTFDGTEHGWTVGPEGSDARLFSADLDNNGILDLVVSAGGQFKIHLRSANDPEGPYGGTPTTLKALGDAQDGTITGVLDLNGDGRLDLAGLDKSGIPMRWINKGNAGYHYQIVRPRADINVKDNSGNSKVNSFGIGGTALVRAGLLAQATAMDSPVLHFGLGEKKRANYVRLLWPNGQAQGEFDMAPDTAQIAKQRLTGSCPWLFAHDGTAMRFVTDILWKSPLGLRINAQDTAGVSQTRDWVKIRADQLKERDGYYDLSITAELWETDFFDHVALMTVDHPAETEVFVDERFSIPQPPLDIRSVRSLGSVRRATDEKGQDVTELVASRDGRYLDTFGLGQYQGVTRDHWVEIELPSVAADGKEHALLATGWIYPTDSSINVALSQGSHRPPQGLSLEVPDGRGGWRTWRSGLGFPAGKNKTVVLPLPKDEPVVRLRTNLEVYWDQLQVASMAQDAAKTQTLAPETADLRYRGFSTVTQERRSSPELPDYNRVAGTSAWWLDLEGFYTRFGDVRELLKGVDDRYVIMNAGDEITLRFKAPAPPPAGWVRDFVFVSDGWDKDGNFNTGYSRTVLPLPSHDRPDYSAAPTPLTDDPVYRRHSRDWVDYHTRWVGQSGLLENALPRRPKGDGVIAKAQRPSSVSMPVSAGLWRSPSITRSGESNGASLKHAPTVRSERTRRSLGSRLSPRAKADPPRDDFYYTFPSPSRGA